MVSEGQLGMSPTTYVLLHFAACAIISYFCGCFNGAVIVSKYILRDDVRNHGSGNAGLTNFYRTFGGPLTLVVILTDMLKMVAAVVIGQILIGNIPVQTLMKYWCGAFCLLGHMFPCMFHFKGGKGILSGGMLALLIDWRLAAVVWIGFFVLAVLTKYVSLGSCWAAFSFPIASWFLYHDPYIFAVAAFSGALSLWMHRGNIKRLLNGTESRFHLHKKQE